MAKRSPFRSYHRRQQAANSKVLDIWFTQVHPCVCGHVQGFHWDTDAGENLGKCADAECGCSAFDEDTFAAAQIAAGIMPTVKAVGEREVEADDDALARAMRSDAENCEVSDEDAWDRALLTNRPNPIGKSRPNTQRDRAALDALRKRQPRGPHRMTR